MIVTVEETAEVWRTRLNDVSWFMRSLNEYIAREANKEDNCTGRFWEGRFKSQALLDEAALAARSGETPKRLMPFAGNPRKDILPFVMADYIALVDMTGRQFAKGKQGVIEDKLPSILERLNLDAGQWGELTCSFESCFYSAAGSEAYLLPYQQRHNLKYIKGKTNASRLFSSV